MIGVSSSGLCSLLEEREQEAILFLGLPVLVWCKWAASPGNINFLWASLDSCADERGVTLDEELWRILLEVLISTFPVPLWGTWLEETWLGRGGRACLPFFNFAMSSFILSLVTSCSLQGACTACEVQRINPGVINGRYLISCNTQMLSRIRYLNRTQSK